MRALRHLLVAAALLAPGAALAQLEHEVKAAFIFKFLSFVDWPAAAFADLGAALVIGVLGAEDVRASLEEVAPGRAAQGRPVAVRAVKPGDSPAGLHVLFVGRAATGQIPKLAPTPGLLVVSEAEGALELGAMINFVRVDGRVRFEAAPEQAERRGLRLSSRMLAVAQNVRPGRL